MGFFSSRKDHASVTTTKGTSVDKSVVQVIRSRFYGKHKGKEREESPASFIPQGPSSAHALSHPTPTTPFQITPTPVASGSTIRPRSHHDRSNPSPSKSKHPPKSTMPQPPSPHPRASDISSTRSLKDANISSLSPRKPADTITVTLAQRLNELAVANSEGLLNDDEYRLLRQNLFERFATSTVVPTEAPVVPVARRPFGRAATLERKPSVSFPRPSSYYHTDAARSPSLRSKSSVTSGMTNLFRQATGRRTASNSKEISDTSSVFSTTSAISNVFKLPRALSKKSSNSSIHTDASRAPTDTISISSRRTGIGSSRSHPDNLSYFSPSVSRSTTTKSLSRLATPPSAFPSRAVGYENKYATSINNVFDEENLQTAQEIRQEIASVEAEGKRLMDAFSGLELSTLTRRQRSAVHPPSTIARDRDRVESTWTLIPDGRSLRRANGPDSDVTSIRSRTSAGTAPSLAYSNRRLQPKLSTSLASRPGSLHRKNSVSSVSSQGKGAGISNAPPVPALPIGMTVGHLRVASNSSVNLSRSTGHLPLSALPEDQVKSSGHDQVEQNHDGEIENEHMMDIQRRREEVSMRYEARLEYLRAKLKGAQLHEKLLRN